MNVLVEEIGSSNKGAYLMFLAVQEKLNKQFDSPHLVVDEKRFSKVEEAKHNLYRFVHFQKFKIKLHNLINPKQLAKYNLMRLNTVDLVLNAGGYANGDFWFQVFGNNRFNKKLERYKYLNKRGVPIILLPQAFDTFNGKFIKNYIIELHKVATIIYARDSVSLSNLQNILGNSEKVKLAPDFTNLLEAPNTNLVKGKYITLIPNSKLIQANVISKKDYIDNLILISNIIHNKGYQLVLLNHEGSDDQELLFEIKDKITFNISLLTNLDAIQVKSVIRDSYFLITGRFHGLVSALSQAVPVLTTSWSHKYLELLKDYNAENQLINIKDSKEIVRVVEENLKEENRSELMTLLKKNSEIQKSKAEKMWLEVFETVRK